MKNQLAVLTILIATGAPDSARAHEVSSRISFRIERGDTYTNLFGRDWQKAYRQSHATVIRNGEFVTSPDILIEGMIVTVTRDVRLTPRASARVAELEQRRAALKARLTELELKLAPIRETQRSAAECRRILGDDVQFAADVDFAARELAHLERMAQPVLFASPPARPRSYQAWGLATGSIALLVLAGTIFWRRNRPVYPEGNVRYRQTLADVRDAFKIVA